MPLNDKLDISASELKDIKAKQSFYCGRCIRYFCKDDIYLATWLGCFMLTLGGGVSIMLAIPLLNPDFNNDHNTTDTSPIKFDKNFAIVGECITLLIAFAGFSTCFYVCRKAIKHGYSPEAQPLRLTLKSRGS